MFSFRWNQPGSRTSVNYDLNSYEAKRLLNLVEERAYEPTPTVPEDQFRFSFAEPVWNINQSQAKSQSPSEYGTSAAVSRNNSDMSLVAPIRRRSLLTPGIATRVPDHPPTPEVPPIPRKSKARFSLPSTPSRRDSFESLSPNLYMLSSPVGNPDSVPRVVTPCEDAYQQTGAFKLGTLRITNGSPLASPAAEFIPIPDRNLQAGLNSDGSRGYLPCPITTGGLWSPKFVTGASESSPALEKPSAIVTDVIELQATSKHTAIEDELFEDEQQEYSRSEVLDVRLDLNAKSLPPRPGPVSECRDSVAIFRSDSGVVTSPRSEYLKKPLAKTDSGYSSNVSLRSYSTKPPVPDKDDDKPLAYAVDAPPQTPPKDEFPPQTPPKDKFPGEARGFPSFESVVGPEVNCPPPVPSKDSKNSRQVLKKSQSARIPPSRLRSLSSPPKNPSSPTEDGRTQATSVASPSELSPVSATSSTSPPPPSGVSSGARKHGKLDRFLGGPRTLHTTHETHPSDMGFIPPIPRDVDMRLSGRMNIFQASRKRLALRTRASRETLGTIMSVGSAEHAHPDDVSDLSLPKSTDIPTAEEGSQGQKSSVSIQSSRLTIIRAATTSIRRKPVPIRVPTEASSEKPETKKTQEKHSRSNSDPVLTSPDQGHLDHTFLAMANEREVYFTPSDNIHRSNTMTAQAERNIGLLNTASYDTPPVPSPTAASSNGQIQKPKGAPPVSMKTRNRGSLRVPTPLRARSTPPRARRSEMVDHLSRRPSREDIKSYPPSVNPRTQPSFLQDTSQDNVWSYPTTQGHYEDLEYGAMAARRENSTRSRRSMSITTDHGEYRVPIWDIQTDHENSSSSGSSSGHKRSNSLMSHEIQHNYRFSRPPAPRSEYSVGPMPRLRYRASHDGLRNQGVEDASMNFCQDNGPYPSIRRADGQAYVSDPWSGWPMPQAWDADGRYPPYILRNHSRNNSLGSHGISAPYRVLHSYNSPAYKHVPIWG
jgi:hypothetical protein